MFERFTKEARAAVVGAQEVARDTATRSIDTRHLLLTLARSPGPARRALQDAGVDVEEMTARVSADLRAGGIDADALAGIGIDLDAIRERVDATFGPHALDIAARRPGGHIPFTPDAKKALELALREAIRLKQRRIHGSHLMLGMLRAESPGRTQLINSGVETDVLPTALEGQGNVA